jgi:hypothetical protein
MSNRIPVFVLAALAACGDGSDDFKPITATVTGAVDIGDAIAHATVFADYNDNNTLDGNDPHVTTDATGHFTLTFENFGPAYPHTIVAIIASDSISVGAKANVGFAVQLRAALDVAQPASVAVDGIVISPFTTLVVSEMGNDPSLSQTTAQANVTAALSASMLTFTGQRLDVMADYAASSSTDDAQLRLAAGSVAAVMSSIVTNINAAQTFIDVNDAKYFDPIVTAMDKQLTAIANGTFMFSQFTADQQLDVVQNPDKYTSLFANTASLEADVEAELAAKVGAEAAALAHELAESFLDQLKEDIVRFAAGELIYLLVEILGEI